MIDAIKVHAYIEAHKDRFVAELQEFCRHPAYAHDGTGIPEVPERTAAMMRSRGIEAEVLPTVGNPIVIGKIEGRSRGALLLYSHYDVLPPGPAGDWKHDPFGAVIDDGKIFCRGVSDHRGSLVSRIQAVEAVRAVSGGNFPATLRFVIEGEEELGSRNLNASVTQYWDRLTSEAGLYSGWWRDEQDRPRMNCGMRGSLRLKLAASGARTDMHTSYSTLVPNPINTLCRAVATMVDADNTPAIDGFGEHIAPLTPADEEALRAIPFDAAKFAERFGVSRLNGGVQGLDAIRRHVFTPVINIGRWEISGGGGVVPATASVQVTLGLVPQQQPDDILEKARIHLARRGFHDIQVDLAAAANKPARVPMDSHIVGVVRDAATAVYGRPPIVMPLSSGSGPRWVFVEKGCAMVADPGVGWSGSSDHAPNENIRVADYIQGIHVAAEIFMRY
jgi:acetylornithine deacetylase/succinyl-diaminopimelate desuccinylase-like protein